MPHKRAPVQLKLPDVDGFYFNRRQKFVHLVIVGEHAVTICGRAVTTKIPLDGFQRLDWSQMCPTCLDGLPGFMEHWRSNHQPIPY